ncbi:AraC family transcriptional regulator [Pontibacter sp. G13]|uniref:AraC family transcriptional regulator n=1 Tax=Pontibacter sp. G13 TaxID=3074898 RepID=UPI00288ABCE3|nr:AraC family transcriptional regulator [Pontibacter sp. G13]WNJ17373.1 AraC family transcriptional regulator [Pontibacter sp. G13]
MRGKFEKIEPVVAPNEVKNLEYLRFSPNEAVAPTREARRFLTYSVLHITEGTGNFVLDEEEYEVKPNTVYFAYPGQILNNRHFYNVRGVHMFANPDFFLGCNDAFPGLTVMNAPELRHEIPLSVAESNYLTDIGTRIMIELENERPVKWDIVKAYISVFMFSMERKFVMTYQDVADNKYPELVRRFFALLRMSNNYNQSVAEIAENLYVSPNYLNSVVKKHTNKTVKQHLQEHMLQQARSLLLNTDLGIKELSYMLGFNYPQYFNRAFKKLTGYTPQGYRMAMA